MHGNAALTSGSLPLSVRSVLKHNRPRRALMRLTPAKRVRMCGHGRCWARGGSRCFSHSAASAALWDCGLKTRLWTSLVAMRTLRTRSYIMNQANQLLGSLVLLSPAFARVVLSRRSLLHTAGLVSVRPRLASARLVHAFTSSS